MSEMLLSTKLTIPHIRQNIVNRQKLIDKLNDSLILPLSIISSPPGFGKTTLVCAWAQQAKVPVGWVSLDEDDNDTARFFQYLYAAVKSIKTDLPDLEIELIKSQNIIVSTLVPFINLLNEIPERFVVVLDDYQEISLPVIHDTLTYLLEHMPGNLHIIITSRADPPFPLARFRARGQLNEIRAADLRFTRTEIDEFSNQVMGLELRPEDLNTLESRTEGWIAGLQLAALSMKGKKDLSSFIAGFTGSHEFIVDYLTDEVLNQQTESVRNFLLCTSILNRLSGSLCDAVIGESNSQQMLEFLDRSNLFINALDNQRTWYRYHRLFADLLRQRLHETYPDRLAELHGKASHWYELNGLDYEAIDHALDGNLYDRAANLIDNVAETLLMRSEVTTFLHWVEMLPHEYLNNRPSLGLYYAWAAVFEGYGLAEIEKRIESIKGFNTDKADSFRSFVSLFQGNIAIAQQQAKRALTHISESEQFLFSSTMWILRLTDILNSDLKNTLLKLEDVTSMTQVVGNVMVTMMILCNIAEMTMRSGQLHTARTLYERILAIAISDDAQPLPVSGMAYLGLADLYREWGEFDKAFHYVDLGLKQVTALTTGSELEAYMHLARIHQSMDDYNASQTAFDKAIALAAAYKTSEIDDEFVELFNKRLWIKQGKLNEVERWVIQRGLDIMDSALVTSYYDYHIFHHRYLTVARLRIAQNKASLALAILDELQILMEKWGWTNSRREIEVHILKAVTLHKLDKGEQALQSLVTALQLAEQGEFIRTFIDEDLAIAELLERIVARDIMTVYASKLLDAFHQELTDISKKSQKLLDPLSDRELEVLRLLSKGLSNPDIAKRLVVAVGTVKAHTSSIYSKLRVTNRVQAVERARELNLV